MPNPFEFAASEVYRQTAPVGVSTNAVLNPITANQSAFLTALMTKKAAIVGGDVDKIAPWVNSLSKTAASDRITEVKEWLAVHEGPRHPAPARTVAGTPDGYAPHADVVPAGRYAIDTGNHEKPGGNVIAFYRVDRPTEGRWAGRVFVKLITGGDEQRLSWTTTKSVLAKIAAAGAQAASARYGHEIGECGVCGRQLTNDESRAAGIGPVCRAKMAW